MGEKEEITPSDFTKTIFEGIAKDTGKAYEDLLKMYVDYRLILDRPQYTEQLNDERARAKVRSSLRSELASPAPVWSGMMLAASDPFDTNARHWELAKSRYESDERQQWIDKGFITSDGKPIDLREVFRTGRKNPNVGKPYPKTNWMRNAVGVLATSETEPMPAKVTLSRQVALKSVPLKVPIQVRLNNRTPEGVLDELQLTGASVTVFRPIDDPDIPHPEDLTEKYCAKYFTTLAELELKHQGFILNPKRREGVRIRLDPLRLTLLDCNLVFVDPAKNETTGNYRMVVEDDSIGFGEDEQGRRGTVIWLPEHLYPEVEHAGRGTRMFIFGQSTQPQTRIDFTTGERLNEPGDVGINATGLMVRRGWFLEKDEDIAEGEEVE